MQEACEFVEPRAEASVGFDSSANDRKPPLVRLPLFVPMPICNHANALRLHRDSRERAGPTPARTRIGAAEPTLPPSPCDTARRGAGHPPHPSVDSAAATTEETDTSGCASIQAKPITLAQAQPKGSAGRRKKATPQPPDPSTPSHAITKQSATPPPPQLTRAVHSSRPPPPSKTSHCHRRRRARGEERGQPRRGGRRRRTSGRAERAGRAGCSGGIPGAGRWRSPTPTRRRTTTAAATWTGRR